MEDQAENQVLGRVKEIYPQLVEIWQQTQTYAGQAVKSIGLSRPSTFYSPFTILTSSFPASLFAWLLQFCSNCYMIWLVRVELSGGSAYSTIFFYWPVVTYTRSQE